MMYFPPLTQQLRGTPNASTSRSEQCCSSILYSHDPVTSISEQLTECSLTSCSDIYYMFPSHVSNELGLIEDDLELDVSKEFCKPCEAMLRQTKFSHMCFACQLLEKQIQLKEDILQYNRKRLNFLKRRSEALNGLSQQNAHATDVDDVDISVNTGFHSTEPEPETPILEMSTNCDVPPAEPMLLNNIGSNSVLEPASTDHPGNTVGLESKIEVAKDVSNCAGTRVVHTMHRSTCATYSTPLVTICRQNLKGPSKILSRPSKFSICTLVRLKDSTHIYHVQLGIEIINEMFRWFWSLKANVWILLLNAHRFEG